MLGELQGSCSLRRRGSLQNWRSSGRVKHSLGRMLALSKQFLQANVEHFSFVPQPNEVMGGQLGKESAKFQH